MTNIKNDILKRTAEVKAIADQAEREDRQLLPAEQGRIKELVAECDELKKAQAKKNESDA
jgi:hypothetical protein